VQVEEGTKPRGTGTDVSKVGGARWKSADKSFHHFSDGPMTIVDFENTVGLLSGGTGKASAMSCFKRCMTLDLCFDLTCGSPLLLRMISKSL